MFKDIFDKIVTQKKSSHKSGVPLVRPQSQKVPVVQKVASASTLPKEDEVEIKQQAKEIILKATEEALKLRQEAERDARRMVEEAVTAEKRIAQKEQEITNKEKELELLKEKTESSKKEIDQKKEEMLKQLEKLSGIGKEKAKELLLGAWEDRLKEDVAKRIRSAEEEIKESAKEKAKEILLDSMRHGATDYVTEYTLSTVHIPSEDVKGRIIGKEGRNIRAFELTTGVDVDLEEEGSIKLSSFDAVKREIARISLEQLIKDGRIQPERIEEVVRKTRSELDQVMFRAGEDLAHKVGVYNLPRDVTTFIGRFKFRFSFGQNLILHTLEETKIGISIAHEVGADANVVRLGCLLHDIGKVVTDKEGSHVDLGVEFAKKHRFPESVIGCIAAHHEDIPFPSLEAVIVAIADSVSGGRPGARHEDFQNYLKRIQAVEEVAKSKKGVKEAYALQAGRELRVIVRPQDISDDEATIMAAKMREELEKKFDVFPGQIKITIIREFRAEATTKI